jgi:tRNA 2-selenouridine synthase
VPTQVLDLEGDANHRGSIFGALGRPAQPTNEQYENVLATQWRGFDAGSRVFIEDESHNVGKCGVPRGLWARMRAPEAEVLRLVVPHEARVAKLVQEYGGYEPRLIADCVRGLNKRLGNEKVAHLCALLEDVQPPALAEVAAALLTDYYDDMYAYQAKKRGEEMGGKLQERVECDGGDALANARRLLDRSQAASAAA